MNSLNMDKDIELQKIQALNGYFQTKINTAYSMFVSFVFGFLILVATLYYQGVFNIIPQTSANFLEAMGARIGNILIYTGVLVLAVYIFRRRMLKSIDDLNDKCLTIIGDLLTKVEKGETLPSIMELKKVAKKK